MNNHINKTPCSGENVGRYQAILFIYTPTFSLERDFQKSKISFPTSLG
jgi:hypothetical protein